MPSTTFVHTDDTGLDLVAHVDLVLDLAAVRVCKLLHRYVTGVLGSQIDRHLGRGDGRDDALDGNTRC